MPILTRPAFAKGSANEITLNKADLALEVSDLYFGDPANWKQVVLFYETSTGKQRKALIYDASQANPAANFDISERARSQWNVKKVAIYDFDGGSLTINRGDLTVAEFDVLFPLFVRDFVADGAFNIDPNIEGGNGTDAESFTQNGLVLGAGGGYYTYEYSPLAPLPLPIMCKLRIYVEAHDGNWDGFFDLSGVGRSYDFRFSNGIVSNYDPNTFPDAVVNGYFERNIVINDPSEGIYLGNSNNMGSLTISKIEFIESGDPLPPVLEALTNVVATQVENTTTVNIAWDASTWNFNPNDIRYTVQKQTSPGGGFIQVASNLTGTNFTDPTIYTPGQQPVYRVKATFPNPFSTLAEDNVTVNLWWTNDSQTPYTTANTLTIV